MTNKYLEKIAARLQDEKDAAKLFAKATAANYAGHAAGMVLGAAALGSPIGRRFVTNISKSKIGTGAKALGEKIKSKEVSKKVGRFFGNKAGPAVAGGLIGGYAGEEAAGYAAIRHGVLQSKQQERNKG